MVKSSFPSCAVALDGNASQEARKGQTNSKELVLDNETLHMTIYQVKNWKPGKDEAAYSAAANNSLTMN